MRRVMSREETGEGVGPGGAADALASARRRKALRGAAVALRRAAVPLVLVALVLTTLFAVAHAAVAPQPAPAALPPYVAFVDAGSTGSRLHVFKVEKGGDGAGSDGRPWFGLSRVAPKLKVTPPLAKLAGLGVEDTADRLGKLFERALELVPPAHRAETPLYVWATAGLRVLPLAQRRRLLETVALAAEKRTPFRVAPHAEHVRVIGGDEEGFFGWLAANHLSGVPVTAIGAGRPIGGTVGALDAGGGSVQVVALPPRVHHVTSLHALKSHIYVRSYLGYGASQLETRLKDSLAASAAAGANLHYPCAFPGLDVAVKGVHLNGAGELDGCFELVKEQMAELKKEQGTEGLPLRATMREGKFLGMSLLFHLTHFLNVVFGDEMPFPQPTIADIRAHAARLCATPWGRVRRDMDGRDPNTPSDRIGGRCFDAALVMALLGDSDGLGFGFPEDGRNITFVEDVAGDELEWTLGAAIATLHPVAVAEKLGLPLSPAPRPTGTHTRSALFMLAMLVLTVVSVTTVYVVFCVPRQAAVGKSAVPRTKSLSDLMI